MAESVALYIPALAGSVVLYIPALAGSVVLYIPALAGSAFAAVLLCFAEAYDNVNISSLDFHSLLHKICIFLAFSYLLKSTYI